ncbi:ATP-binding protein, partial [Ralstonia solanacearum]|uniref:ATP-binding protein n=1 Tax=Ralstonia solanacearum TaxID=305 RepID=UPI0018B0DEF2
MSLAVLRSRALAGIDAPAVSVEVHLANGLPSFTIVGLPDTEVKESKDRVRAAIQNSRFEFPTRRITVNLAPADLPKESGRFDLPIALGILAASRQIPQTHLDAHEFAGELSLSGDLRPIRGALAMAYALSCHPGLPDGDALLARAFVLPDENAAEAALVSGTRVLPARTLIEVCDHLSAPDRKLAPAVPARVGTGTRYPDLADVRGQPQARRALEGGGGG